MDLAAYMRNQGVPCVDPIEVDGRIHRFRVDGAGTKKNGWYTFIEFKGKVYGAFGDWKSGVSRRLNGSGAPAEVIDAFRKVDALKAKERERGIRYAQRLYEEAKPTGESPYIKRKGIVPTKLVRFYWDELRIPMFDVHGEMVGMQRIFADGKKLFIKGAQKQHTFHPIGGSSITAICEGYATGVSIALASGWSVLVAWDRTNLINVARMAHEQGRRIVVCADNDHRTPSNPGLVAARAAADAVGAKVVIPDCGGTDFNDMHLERGLDAVRERLWGAL